MFASVRRYRLESGSIDDLLHLVDTDFAESVQEMDGFMEYQVVECGNGEIVTITTFKDRHSAEESMGMSADWVRDTLVAQVRADAARGVRGRGRDQPGVRGRDGPRAVLGNDDGGAGEAAGAQVLERAAGVGERVLGHVRAHGTRGASARNSRPSSRVRLATERTVRSPQSSS